MSYLDEEFVLNCMPEILAAKEAADTGAQLFFELERVGHYAFGGDLCSTWKYGMETIRKCLNTRAIRDLECKLIELLGNRSRTERLLALLEIATELLDAIAAFGPDGNVPGFQEMTSAETLCLKFSHLLRDLVRETFPKPVVAGEEEG